MRSMLLLLFLLVVSCGHTTRGLDPTPQPDTNTEGFSQEPLPSCDPELSSEILYPRVQSLHAELLQTRNRLRRAKNDWSALREEVVQRQQNVPQPDSLFDVLARIKRTERKLDDLTERFARAYMITGQSIESLQAAHKKATDIRSQLPRIKNEQEREDVKRILDVLFSQIHDDLQNTCSSAVTFIVLSSMDEVSTSQIEQLRHQLTHTP